MKKVHACGRCGAEFSTKAACWDHLDNSCPKNITDRHRLEWVMANWKTQVLHENGKITNEPKFPTRESIDAEMAKERK